MKRILALHSSCELYGADRIFAKVIQFLESDGYTVDILLKNDGDLVSYIKKYSKANFIFRHDLPILARSLISLKSLTLYIFQNISFFLFLLKIRKNYDTVYINTLSLFSCSFLANIIGINKIIMHSHEMIGYHGLRAKMIISITHKFATKVICVSMAVKNDMEQSSYIKNSKKFVIVHNGIEDIYNNRLSECRNNKISFLLLGRIMPEKGQWYLIETLKLINKKYLEKITVQLIGSPPPFRKHLLNNLKKLIINNHLERIVTVIDFVNDPYIYVQQSDVCLIPSIMPDPFPTTVIEAMSCGKALITTNNGGAKEIVQHKFNGFLIEPNNCEQFKKAIEYFIDNPLELKNFGCNSRKIFLEKLNIIDFKDRLLSTFR